MFSTDRSHPPNVAGSYRAVKQVMEGGKAASSEMNRRQAHARPVTPKGNLHAGGGYFAAPSAINRRRGPGRGDRPRMIASPRTRAGRGQASGGPCKNQPTPNRSVAAHGHSHVRDAICWQRRHWPSVGCRQIVAVCRLSSIANDRAHPRQIDLLCQVRESRAKLRAGGMAPNITRIRHSLSSNSRITLTWPKVPAKRGNSPRSWSERPISSGIPDRP